MIKYIKYLLETIRVYIVEHKDFNKLKGWMDGVGGFADELDKILIITGNISVYRKGEGFPETTIATRL